MTDGRGLFEHAKLSAPRREHGYCVDDVARALVVLCREPAPDQRVKRLANLYLTFVLSAIDPLGACHNRMDAEGQWRDVASLGDWWGRAVWGLGYCAAHAHTAGMRARALVGFRIAAGRRSPHVRAMVFAALGAAEVLGTRTTEPAARSLLRDAVRAIGPPVTDPGWPWPEPRLAYGNGALAEALIVSGAALGDGRAAGHGLDLLEFLLRVETRDGHISVTPVGGRGRDDVGPGFDQQPIEVAALADACASAFQVTGDADFLAGIRLAWRWFAGDNDSATPMFDRATGGGYDGLECGGRNQNQGAESTLAMLSTAQHARRVHGLS
ncbi:MAG: glycosyltransferase [Actinomycetota bacterium]|nr:glycosyltransferase [Actinomycetota bacterium]